MISCDCYGEARRLAFELEGAGFSRFSDSILNAIIEGGTGTETFMMMRFKLSQIIGVDNLPPDLKDRAIFLHKKINDALS